SFSLFITKKVKAGALELDDQASRGSSSSTPRNGMNRGVSTLDFILRLIAIMATLVSAIAMGTTSKTLPFITWFIHVSVFHLCTKLIRMSCINRFFVIANSIVCAYLVVCLAISILHITRSAAQGTRVILIFFDTVFSTTLLYMPLNECAVQNFFNLEKIQKM
ncbi:hypothetical protein HYC85_003017, partial [Camellia sinensis]